MLLLVEQLAICCVWSKGANKVGATCCPFSVAHCARIIHGRVVAATSAAGVQLHGCGAHLAGLGGEAELLLDVARESFARKLAHLCRLAHQRLLVVLLVVARNWIEADNYGRAVGKVHRVALEHWARP